MPSHAFFKNFFVKIGEPETPHLVEHEPGKTRTHIFIPASLADNLILEKMDPEYRKNLENLPEHLRRQLLEGDWDIAEGMAFQEWRDHIHVIPPFRIPDEWIRFRSLDWGFSKPYSVGWYAIDHDGRMYKYRELYGWGGRDDKGSQEDPEDVAEKIIRLEQYEKIHYAVADSSIFGSRQDNYPTVAEQFQTAFGSRAIPWQPITKGPGSRISGKLELHHRLKWSDTEQPMLLFFNTCKHTIRTLPNMILDENNPEDVDTTLEDHCLIGETMVETSTGARPIKELVGTEGFVLSHDGLFHPYYDCRMTQSNVTVFTVELEDGRTATATANHRFMLSDGTWKRLDELQVGDDIMDVIEHGSNDNQRDDTGISGETVLSV